MLLTGADPAPALAFALHLQDRLAEPYDSGTGRQLRIPAAIGIACAPLHATRAQSLTERADAAMYEAKRTGRLCIWDARLGPGSVSATGDHRPNPGLGACPIGVRGQAAAFRGEAPPGASGGRIVGSGRSGG